MTRSERRTTSAISTITRIGRRPPSRTAPINAASSSTFAGACYPPTTTLLVLIRRTAQHATSSPLSSRRCASMNIQTGMRSPSKTRSIRWRSSTHPASACTSCYSGPNFECTESDWMRSSRTRSTSPRAGSAYLVVLQSSVNVVASTKQRLTHYTRRLLTTRCVGSCEDCSRLKTATISASSGH